MKVRVYFRKVTEGDVVIDVPEGTSSCEFSEIAEEEYTDGDCYVNDFFDMTNYEILED